jgi:hypothetical protein
MRRPRAMWRVMPGISLDSDTADRMLGGEVRSADAPPGYERLCELFDSLRGVSGSPEVLGIAPAPRIPARPPSFGLARGLRRSTVAFAVALSLMGGAAFAAGLPQAASRTAADVLDRLGVSVPSMDSRSEPPSKGTSVPTQRGEGANAGVPGQTPTASRGRDDDHSGTTTSKGEKKGATNDPAASGGKSKAGDPPGRGYGRGGRHGGNPPGHSGKNQGRGNHPGKPGTRDHGKSGSSNGTRPQGRPAPAGGPRHAHQGGKKTPPPTQKR